MPLSSVRNMACPGAGVAPAHRVVQRGPTRWEPSIKIRAVYGSASHLFLPLFRNGF